MKKVIGFIDGFNLYHALIRENVEGLQHLAHYRWLDYQKLITAFLRRDETLVDTYLFTAYADWNEAKKERHKILIQANKSRGAKVVFGKFGKVTKNCQICNRTYTTYEEKRTDVNIAISMLKLAVNNTFDKALLVSADSDLIPATQAIKEVRPNLKVTVVAPIGLTGQALANVAHHQLIMERNYLNKAVLPPTIETAYGLIENPMNGSCC